MDITPTLLRMAVREVIADRDQSVEGIAPEIGFHPTPLRVWLHNPRTDARMIDRAVDRWLAKIETEQRKARALELKSQSVKQRGRPIRDPNAPKRCPRCGITQSRDQFTWRSDGQTGAYCKPCARDVVKEHAERRKAQRLAVA